MLFAKTPASNRWGRAVGKADKMIILQAISTSAPGAQSHGGALNDGVVGSTMLTQLRGKGDQIVTYQFSIHLWWESASRHKNCRALPACLIVNWVFCQSQNKAPPCSQVCPVSLLGAEVTAVET